MKKVKFLGRAFGEYLDTPYSIVEVYQGQDYDVDAEKDCIRNSDNWMPCSKPLFEILEVEIPEWMEPEKFDSHTWKWYTRIGGTEELGKEVFEKITLIENGALRLACVQLLKTKKFKSEFRKSLYNQLLDWIKEPQFYSPFSYNQQLALLNSFTLMKAKQIGVI